MRNLMIGVVLVDDDDVPRESQRQKDDKKSPTSNPWVRRLSRVEKQMFDSSILLLCLRAIVEKRTELHRRLHVPGES